MEQNREKVPSALVGSWDALKAGLHGTICRPDLLARRRRSANLACTLTADERPIHGNENRSDSKNLLHCNRFFEVGPTLREKPPCQSNGMRVGNAHKYLKNQSVQNGGY